MSTIKSTHDLLDQTDHQAPGIPSPNAAGQRSNYCYLFRALADDPEAGRFTGTDDETTVRRLKEFELAFRLPWTPLPALRMRLPAAYTYFGQFMNHDISAPIGGLLVNVGMTPPTGIIGTADPAGLGKEWRADTATILQHFVNEHSEPLTLASLYGDGPQSSDGEVRQLYQEDKRFRLAITSVSNDQTFVDLASVFYATGAPDIPRHNRTPLIADHRNDGNLILCQLHLAFMLVHNKAVTALEGRYRNATDCFREARQLVTLHYHWLILNDFLPKILSKSVLCKPFSEWELRQSEPNTVPMEFTTAAFRFGHSMVGRAYDFNANFSNGGRISTAGASLTQLFNFTSRNNMEQPLGPPLQLPNHWVIDWDRMTCAPKPDPVPGDLQGGAERIDLDFAPDMLNVAGDAQVAEHGSILFRNLLRGFHRRMPFGQRLAEECNVEPLAPDQVREAMPQYRSPSGDYDDPAKAAAGLGFLDETPAWLYFLCEAKMLENGERVGPTASRIIAHTFVGLMRHNPASVLLHEGGAWHPQDSVLKDKYGKALTSLRAFLLYATEGISQAQS